MINISDILKKAGTREFNAEFPRESLYAESSLDPRYFERSVKRGKDKGKMPINEPRLMKEAFSAMSKADHARRAQILRDREKAAKSAYHHAIQVAIQKYGDVTGTHTSGIYNPDFPEAVKAQLRKLARHHLFGDAARAHWSAAGKRTRLE